MNLKSRVLIIYKRSPLLSAGTSIAAANTRFRQNHACHYETLRKIETILKSFGLSSHQHLRGIKSDHRNYSLIITVGGDGTFMHAARHARKDQLILGVNSDPSWSVGKFCSANAVSFEAILRQTLLKPKFKKVYKLTACFLNENPMLKVESLNDILFCHANPAAMSRYTLAIGRMSEEQRSSGIWLSSAAGSTGAIFSAGGIRLPIESRAIQYMPRELYSGKEIHYDLKGGIIQHNKFIDITSKIPHGRVFFDGAHIKYPLTFGKTIRIQSSIDYIRMIHA